MKSDCACKKLKRERVTKDICIGGQTVQVVNAPARVCQDCGEIHFEGRFLLDLEKKIHRQQKQAAPVKNPEKLTDKDNADIRAARRAKAEYLRTGESYTVDELRAEFNL
jgi:YgiT-type zinc finger domain-containing protein